MRSKNKLGNSLLELSKKVKDTGLLKHKISPKISDTIGQILVKRFSNLKLSPDHFIIIARLFDKTLSDKGRIEPLSLLHEIYQDPRTVLNKLDLIIDLMETKIIECDQKKYMKVSRRGGKIRIKFDKATLIDVYIGFTERFISYVLNNKKCNYDSRPKPFKNNQEFLESWFDYIDEYLASKSRGAFYSRNHDELEKSAISIKQEIDDRLKLTTKHIPFNDITKEYNLSEKEQIVLMFVLKKSLDGSTASKEDIISILREDPYDKFTRPSILLPSATLLREQLLVELNNPFFISHDNVYDISPDVGARIVNRHKYNEESMIGNILCDNEILSHQKPTKNLNQIVLPKKQINIVKESISRFKIQENLLIDQELSKYSINKGLLILLYGPPGTGKTALANGIAKYLKKSILITDISRIIDKWVGNSEKNISKLFTSYCKISRRIKNVPVLLLNEADQLLSFRGSANDSVDRMYNQMQNILLENLEKFEGILIATTNLLQNIDSAFSRRFEIKLKLDIPDLPSRKKLWRILLPKNFLVSKNICVDELAENYVFTGGQIELVIRNALSAALYRKNTDYAITKSDLIKYAELEKNNSFDLNNRKAIGFE